MSDSEKQEGAQKEIISDLEYDVDRLSAEIDELTKGLEYKDKRIDTLVDQLEHAESVIEEAAYMLNYYKRKSS